MIVCDRDFRNYIIIFSLLLAMMALITVNKVVDIGDGVTHNNHEDTITTPLPGNCPCGYPNDCGGCEGKPAITLMPTVTIEPIPTFGGTPEPATPDIPDPTQFPTIFPTFMIDGLLPTPINVMGIPTIAPTLVAPEFPASPIPVGNQ